MSLVPPPSLIKLLEHFGTIVTSLVIPSIPQGTGALIRSSCHLVGYPVAFVLASAAVVQVYLTMRAAKALVENIMWTVSSKDPKTRALRMCYQRSRAVPTLSYYEMMFVDGIIDPNDNDSSFAKIYGFVEMKRLLTSKVIRPLRRSEKDLEPFVKGIFEPFVKGLILSGYSRFQQRRLAKAIAKEAGAVFVPIQLSGIRAMWNGEIEKVLAACFSLAQKLQPAIVFIDHLDHIQLLESSLKADLLTLWDAAASNSRVLVVVSSNPSSVVDSDILHRLDVTQSSPVGLTDANRLTFSNQLTASVLERKLFG